ncbi:hypothetical protein AAHS21_13945 [Mycobacterium sp. 050272]|uniref:hypothetical protein n=1 Tax=Mycobacterium sp. 050272 TaxID=3142488 RepID=UPI0031860C46
MAPQTLISAAADLPPMRDWVASTGFAGICAILAALLILLTVMIAARRADERSNHETEQHRRAAAIAQCWQRLTWVITTADTEPAATDPATANMGLGPELAQELLKGISRDAKELGDETLEKAAAVYLSQLGLVLTQQAQRLTESATATRQLTNTTPGAHAATPADSPDKEESETAGGQGRRRR